MYWVKRVLVALGVLALLVGVVLVALLLLVNPNDYKGALQEAVQERFERNLAIDGDIRLSVVPRLGLEINGVALSEPNSTQVFAAVDTARVAVAWWPLLSRHLVVEHLAVNGVKANVVRDAQGTFNFADLLRPDAHVEPEQATPQKDTDTPSVQLDVGGISLNGGEIAYRDEANDLAVRMERLALSASNISFGQPFDFTASGRILGQSPRADATVQLQGAMSLDPHAGRYAIGNLDLRVAGVLPSVRANQFTVRGNADFDAGASAINVSGLAVAFQGDIALSTPLTGVDAQITAPRLRARFGETELALEKLGIKASGRMDNLPFAFSLDAPDLRIANETASGGAMQMSFTREGSRPIGAKLSTSDVSGSADGFDIAKVNVLLTQRQGDRSGELSFSSPLRASWADKTLALPDLQALLKVSHPSLEGGSLTVPATGRFDFDIAGEKAGGSLRATIEGGALQTQFELAGFQKPALTFDVNADVLDLDKLWPAAAANGAATPAPPAKGGDAPAAAGAPVDLAMLNAIDAKGRVRIGQLMARGLHARDVAANLDLAGGRAQLSNVAAKVYEGGFSGQAFADAGTQQFGLQARFTDIAIQPLLREVAQYEALSGRGDLRLDLRATGKTTDALRRDLSGKVELDIRDGQYRGINIAQSLREFKAMLGRGEATEAASDTARATDFSELHATLALQQGVGSLQPLLVAAPLLRLTEGQPHIVNLADNTLDLTVLAKVVNTSTGQDGKELEALHGITVPIHFGGSLDAPRYAVRWGEVGREVLERKLKNEAQRQLEKLFDRDRDADGAVPQDESGENPTGKILGEALKGLFNK